MEGIPRSRILLAALAGMFATGLALITPARDAPLPISPSPERGAAPAVPDAKMPEEMKLRLEHHLQVERLILDKLLIGLLLIVAGYGVNSLIESYKATAAQSHYFLDKRLAAAIEIRKRLTGVVDPLLEITLSRCTGAIESTELVESTRSGLGALTNTLNSNSLFLKEDYKVEAERAISIFRGTLAQACFESCDMREFIDQVSQYVTDETREQVIPGGGAAVMAPRGRSFKPVAWTGTHLQREGNSAFMVANFKAWSERQAAPSPVHRVCNK
ncbi:hypothetical protein QTI33_09525 [Variovorax sp. J22P271]|uniref:hypothetical protein n=1 Tax=Variovorax davisae TaxID=3053515 RepID=UPI002574FC08|nr:hypothetical protein [Variovorax sp. J22P271]MDM0032363.1 hypothetical protein [Variovorax sp. J22P271]